ncbi:MAG: hypothetical protein N2440_03885 [Actinobacteria bacterium]|nr:hypothetical protein [Actinomycetota bacterium]
MKAIRFAPLWIRSLDDADKITFFSFVFSFFLLINSKVFNLYDILEYALLVFLFITQIKFKSDGEISKAEFTVHLFLMVSFITVLTSNGYKSPFLPLLLSSLLLITLRSNLLKSIISVALTFSVLLFHAYVGSVNKSTSAIIYLSSLSFSYLLASVLIHLSKAKNLSNNNDILSLPEEFQAKTFIEKLWYVLDLEKAISKMRSEELIITEYFRQNPLCPPVCEVIVVYRPESKIVLYKYDIDTEKISSSTVNLPFSFEKRIPPEKIYDNVLKEFKLTTSNELFAIYHFSGTLESVNSHLIKLIDSLFVEVLAEARLLSYKNLVIEQLISAENFLHSLLKEGPPKDLLENAALSVKKIAFVEKSFLIPCNDLKEGKPNMEKAIIKGPFIRYPEDAWRINVEMLAEEICRTGIPKIIETEKFKIFAVPIKDSNYIYGVLGGIAAKDAVVERALSSAEFTASVLALQLRRLIVEPFFTEPSVVDKSLFLRFHSKILNLQEIVHQLESRTELKPNSSRILPILKEVEQAIYRILFRAIDEENQKVSTSILKSALKDIKEKLHQTNISLNYSFEGEFTIEPKIMRSIIIIIIEALTNALVHSNATEIALGLKEMDGNLLVYISDNGLGFNLRAVLDELKKNKERYSGLKKIAFETKNIGGNLKIRSSPSSGTSVEVYISVKKDNS